MIHLKLKVILVVLFLSVITTRSSFLFSQTSKVIDKFGNELVTKSNPITKSIKKIYRVKSPISRYGFSVGQINLDNIAELAQVRKFLIISRLTSS